MYVCLHKLVRECVAWLFDHATGPATPNGVICLAAACNTAPTWPAVNAQQTLCWFKLTNIRLQGMDPWYLLVESIVSCT